MKILSVNAGSSSLKFKAYEMPKEEVLASGNFERIGIEGSFYPARVLQHGISYLLLKLCMLECFKWTEVRWLVLLVNMAACIMQMTFHKEVHSLS